MHEDLKSAVDAAFPSLVAELSSLVRIPSVSALDAPEVHRSAAAVKLLLEDSGFSAVRLLEIDGAHPAVYGEIPGPAGAPTVLLYAHHDVQPPGPGWTLEPFEPFERDGRLYGRGSADDKAGILMHVGAIIAHGGTPPVTVKVFIEGEEEIGSEHLAQFLDAYGGLLAADVIVIGDSGNWRIGTPALTTSLRGLVDCTVEVRTLRHAVHSGTFGGVFPDALMTLSRLLASLHDDRGRVTVPGLVSGPSPELDLTEHELRGYASAVDGLTIIGDGNLTSKTWSQPALSVLAIDAPTVKDAVNALVPSARAKISMRLAPGDDPARAMDALVGHLEQNVPWGAEVIVTPGASGEAFALDTSGPAYDAFRSAFAEAWDTPPVEMGVGGSIPFVAAFSESHPGAAILLTGVADPTSDYH
ncbi:MAG: M20/M25/M40 family metallo-hydrolase, partial [Acidimicrobiia bacterium]|nr:M20/M25/M40 family metallo-hydrolase [Acidimicrobiia bacterium]